MQIDWLTVIAQLVNFLVLVWLMQRLLYQPVINAMKEREQRIGARLNEAQRREDQADAELHRYQEKLAQFEQARDEKLAKAREAAEKEKHKRLVEARHEIDEQSKKWRDELRREQEELRKEVKRVLGEAAVGIARRVLSDVADTRLEEQIAATFLRHWERLPEQERAPFTHGNAPLRVAAAFDLDERMRERLRNAVPGGAGIEFTRDPDLLCGIALTGAGHRLDWNVQDYLDEAEQRVRERLAASTREESEHA